MIVEVSITVHALFLIITCLIALDGLRAIFSPYRQLWFIATLFVGYGCCVYISNEYPLIAFVLYSLLMYTCTEAGLGNYTVYKYARSLFGRDFNFQYRRLYDRNVDQVATIDAFEKLPHECFETYNISRDVIGVRIKNDLSQKYLDKDGCLKDCYIIDDAYIMFMVDVLLPTDKITELTNVTSNYVMYNKLHEICNLYFEVQKFGWYSQEAEWQYAVNSKFRKINTILIRDNSHLTYLINGEVKPGDTLYTHFGFGHFLISVLPLITQYTLIGYYGFLCDYLKMKAINNLNSRIDQDILFVIYKEFLKIQSEHHIEICQPSNPYALKYNVDNYNPITYHITNETIAAIQQEIPVLKRASLN